jgi:hypothetical protein
MAIQDFLVHMDDIKSCRARLTQQFKLQQRMMHTCLAYIAKQASW